MGADLVLTERDHGPHAVSYQFEDGALMVTLKEPSPTWPITARSLSILALYIFLRDEGYGHYAYWSWDEEERADVFFFACPDGYTELDVSIRDMFDAWHCGDCSVSPA